jgi:Tannase-like family of unknown function (DUF6351)
VAVLVCSSAAVAVSSAAGAATDGRRVVAEHAHGGSSAIAVLSSRPEHTTGGDAVIRVDVPSRVSLRTVEVFLNDADVTSSFRHDAAAHALVGLVSGFVDGRNTMSAHAKGFGARVRVRNSPSYGPIFSGPHQRPWICQTEASGLGSPPQSGPCVAPTRFDWFYRTTTGQFAPYDSANPPGDLAQTTTIDGKTVDYIVRVESGTINESIYRIAILDDPANPISDPWSPGGTAGDPAGTAS